MIEVIFGKFPTMKDPSKDESYIVGKKDKTITLLSILPIGEEFHLMISYVVRKNDD